MCTPPSPAAVLDPGAAMVCTFDLTATSSAGPVELAGTASGGTGPDAVATAETAVQAAGMSVAIGLPANVIAGATAPGTLVSTNSGPAAAPRRVVGHMPSGGALGPRPAAQPVFHLPAQPAPGEGGFGDLVVCGAHAAEYASGRWAMPPK